MMSNVIFDGHFLDNNTLYENSFMT